MPRPSPLLLPDTELPDPMPSAPDSPAVNRSLSDLPPESLTGPPLSAKRRRGAPLGNLNAVKHGYYSHIVRAPLSGDPQPPKALSLQSEIDLLRLIVLHAMQRCTQFNDPEMELRYLSVVSHALATLSRLVKTQHFLTSGGSGQGFEQLALVAAELSREWDPSLPPADD